MRSLVMQLYLFCMVKVLKNRAVMACEIIKLLKYNN
jgi:hypothetical protein